MTAVYAHIGGLPLEETITQLAPAGLAVLVALRVARERARGWASSLARAGGGPVDEPVTTVSRRRERRSHRMVVHRDLDEALEAAEQPRPDK